MCMCMCLSHAPSCVFTTSDDQISWDLKPSLYIACAIKKIKELGCWEELADTDPDVFEVFVRITGSRVTASGASSSGSTSCPSGSTSGSTSGSSGSPS